MRAAVISMSALASYLDAATSYLTSMKEFSDYPALQAAETDRVMAKLSEESFSFAEATTIAVKIRSADFLVSQKDRLLAALASKVHNMPGTTQMSCRRCLQDFVDFIHFLLSVECRYGRRLY